MYHKQHKLTDTSSSAGAKIALVLDLDLDSSRLQEPQRRVVAFY